MSRGARALVFAALGALVVFSGTHDLANGSLALTTPRATNGDEPH